MIKDQLKLDRVEAMKSKDVYRLKTINVLIGELQRVELADPNDKNYKPYTEALEISVINGIINANEEIRKILIKKGNPTDVVDSELEVLKHYVPKVDEEAIKSCARIIISLRKQAQGSISMKDMKPVLAAVQETYPSANGALVSNILKEFI